MLYFAHSTARLVSITTPAFAARYATLALATMAEIDAVLMILPRPRSMSAPQPARRKQLKRQSRLRHWSIGSSSWERRNEAPAITAR